MPYTVKGECRNTGRTHFKKGDKAWAEGKTFTDEHRIKISEGKKGQASFQGKHHSEETKKKISLKVSQLLKGNKRSAGKPWSEARRKAQEIRRLLHPPKNKQAYYSKNWKEIRKIIYQRDKWICQECGVHCRNKGKGLRKFLIQCHHINYDISDNNLSNLITLCAGCHLKTNYKREDWTNHYQKKTKEKKLWLA